VAEQLAVLDLETYGIDTRPRYPPKPVGLASYVDGQKDYQPCRAESDKKRCAQRIRSWVRAGYTLVFHHAGFDLDVLETHLGISWPARHHDTLLLAYLFEPRASTFSLKPLCEKLFGEKPLERDALRDWILEHVKGATTKSWGAYISEAPFELVRPYAIGDVTRTYRLVKHFLAQLNKDKQMRGAYDRERKVTRVLIKMERRGVPVAVRALSRDVKLWQARQQALETKLYADLKVPSSKRGPDFPWSGKNFAHQVLKSGLIDDLPLTKKGNYSTSADNLGPLLPPRVAHRLEVRAQLQTCIQTFALSWLKQARDGGRFYARYNQVRQDYHGSGAMVGTTTGRLSMTPNLQNVIRSDKGELVPQLRAYLIPIRGCWWLKLDYAQQEFRIFAHVESGEFLERYQQDPTMDAHTVVGMILKERAGVTLARREVKDINFGVLYGMGREKMARKLKLDDITTQRTLKAYHAALPGIKVLQKMFKARAEAGEPIYTWGGRRYFVETPRIVTKERYGVKRLEEQTYEYKLLNLYVQGSAADATKEAMVRYDESGWNEDDMAPLLLQVHDELDAMAPKGREREAMGQLRKAMESIELDIPLLTDRLASLKSWDAAKEVVW
jgi:DNA polymerase-1